MYIEFKQGEKYAAVNPETSDSHEAFQDCGYLIEDDEVIVDIDDISHEQIKELIKRFDIHTQIVWTTRGAHLYFKKPVGYTRAINGICALGFKIESKNSKNKPDGITIKRNGVLRDIDNEGERETLPWYFARKTKYQDLNGIGENEGRNNLLFAHARKLNGHEDTPKILRFINEVLFAEPLPEKEFEIVSRDYQSTDGMSGTTEYDIANNIINVYRCVMYQGSIWWWNGSEYVTDGEDNSRLKKMIYERCPGKPTKFIDEIIKQISYRVEKKGLEAYPLRFTNGYIRDDEFFYSENFDEFTPYYIKIPYIEDAEAVPEVDEYIDNVTDHDENYKKLILEVMGYAMMMDPERIRSLGKFFFFRGNGANGKGTLLQILKKIYNEENCTSLDIDQMTDYRYQSTMIGKLANLGDDIKPDAINNDQMKMLKNISTADMVSTRRLYKSSMNATFTIKLYFTTNADIKTFEKGYAYKRRVMWLPMFNKVEKPDPHFITKMTSDTALKYWIRLIVEGYFRLYENDKFTQSDKVEEFNEEYHRNNNYMSMFLQDINLETDILGRTGKEVKDKFNEWNDDDTRRYSPKLLQETLKEMRIGQGMKKGIGRVYMRESETSQKLRGLD